MTTADWQTSASCAGLDPKYFEFTQRGDPGYRPEGNLARKGEAMGIVRSNEVRLRKGAKVCINCPVKGQCLEESSRVDRFWTIRGGVLPEALTRPLASAPTETVNSYFPYRCPKGCHVDYLSWRNHKGSQVRYCKNCNK